jgi:nicotinamidase-related amidase
MMNLRAIPQAAIQAANHWFNGYKPQEATTAYRDSQKSPPTLETVLRGDTRHCAHHFHLSSRMPYFAQEVPHTLKACIGGWMALPGAAIKTVAHIIKQPTYPIKAKTPEVTNESGESISDVKTQEMVTEGIRTVFPRDVRNLTQAVKCATWGIPLTAVRIVLMTTDPFKFIAKGFAHLVVDNYYRRFKKDLTYIQHGKIAVLNIRGQNSFCPKTGDRSPGTGENAVEGAQDALDKLADLAKAARWNTITLFNIQEVNTSEEPYCVANTPGAQFHSIVAKTFEKAYTILTNRKSPNAFGEVNFSTELRAHLKANYIKTVVLAGLDPNSDFIQKTAEEAVRLQFQVIIAKEAVAVKSTDTRDEIDSNPSNMKASENSEFFEMKAHFSSHQPQ